VVTTNATPCCTPGTSSTQVSSVITITGLGDHDQPDWLITMTGIRSAGLDGEPRGRGTIGRAARCDAAIGTLTPLHHAADRQASE
jgi:hypothetical protein